MVDFLISWIIYCSFRHLGCAVCLQSYLESNYRLSFLALSRLLVTFKFAAFLKMESKNVANKIADWSGPSVRGRKIMLLSQL